MLHQTMCLRTFERRESPDLAYMRQKLDDEFRETERGGVRGVLAEGRPRVARERTMHPARTKHFEEEMTQAISILFTLEVPGHAIRLPTAIDPDRATRGVS